MVNGRLDVKNTQPAGKRRSRTRPAQDAPPTIDRQDLRDDLGKRLREARESRNIGLRELARRLGVSPSLISQIETGKSEPSINTLFAIVGELELPVNEIVFDAAAGLRSLRGEDGILGRGGAAGAGDTVSAEPPNSPVQRSTNRTSISLESGVSWQRLTAQPDHDVDFLYLRYPPGSESTPSHSLMRHNGTEYGYVVKGRLEVSIGFDSYELGPGDTISFDCTQPHRFATIGDEPVEAVWFVVGRRNTLSVDDASIVP